MDKQYAVYACSDALSALKREKILLHATVWVKSQMGKYRVILPT